MEPLTQTLTEEEAALLTQFNCLAHDMMRKKAAETGKIVPCWLCCSEDARHEARVDAMWAIRGASDRLTMPMAEAERVAEDGLPDHLVERWRRAEIASKAERALGDPRAFFA